MTLREREEQNALQDYSRSLRAVEDARHKLELVQDELDHARSEMSKKLAANPPAGQLAQMQEYCQTIEKRERECDYAVNVAQNKSQQCFLKLVGARQARSVVEKAQEQQKQRYDQERRKQEQKQIDEMAGREKPASQLLRVHKTALWN